MTGKTEKIIVSTPLGIHELELALIRELAAWNDWDLPAAASELVLMKRICGKTEWVDSFLPLVEELNRKIRVAEQVVQSRDTTLLGAAQTNLEQAVFALRDKLYK